MRNGNVSRTGGFRWIGLAAFAAALAFCLLATVAPAAFAADGADEASSSNNVRVIHITSEESLIEASNSIEQLNKSNQPYMFSLEADLDLRSYTYGDQHFTIGTWDEYDLDNAFAGTFEGNGHTVTYILNGRSREDIDSLGLFGVVADRSAYTGWPPEIRDLQVKVSCPESEEEVNTTTTAGGVVGTLLGAAKVTNVVCTLDGAFYPSGYCRNHRTCAFGVIVGRVCAGGYTTNNAGAQISCCAAKGNAACHANVGGTGEYFAVGGILGVVDTESVTIDSCYSTFSHNGRPLYKNTYSYASNIIGVVEESGSASALNRTVTVNNCVGAGIIDSYKEMEYTYAGGYFAGGILSLQCDAPASATGSLVLKLNGNWFYADDDNGNMADPTQESNLHPLICAIGGTKAYNCPGCTSVFRNRGIQAKDLSSSGNYAGQQLVASYRSSGSIPPYYYLVPYLSFETPENPEVNVEDIYGMRRIALYCQQGYNYAGISIKLNKDLEFAASGDESDASSVAYVPIGGSNSSGEYDPSCYFAGNFYGNGHKVTYQLDSEASCQGLFGLVQGSAENPAVIRDLVVEGRLTIHGSQGTRAGGAVGWLAGGSKLVNVRSNVAVTGYREVGGLVGKVTTAFVSEEVQPTYAEGTAADVVISGCSSTESVMGEINGYTGGLIGHAKAIARYGCSISLTDCYNTSQVTTYGIVASGDDARFAPGGLIGCAENNVSLKACFNAGEVSRTSPFNTSGCYPAALVGYSTTHTDAEGNQAADVTFSPYPAYMIGTCCMYEDTARTGVIDRAVGNLPNVSEGAIFNATDGLLVSMLTSGEDSSWICERTMQVTVQGAQVAVTLPVLSWEMGNQPPAISTQPENITINRDAGSSEKPAFSVGASHVQTGVKLIYQWQVSETEGGTYKDVEGATDATYAPPVEELGLGRTYYRCVVAVKGAPALRTTTNSVYAQVEGTCAKPQVSISASGLNEDGSADQGAEVTLSANASCADSRAKLVYAWYKDGNLVADATARTLAVDTSKTGSYTYQVKVTASYDPYGAASESTAKVGIKVGSQMNISTQAELEALAAAVNSGVATFEGAEVSLAADITVSDASFEGIGTQDHPFKGSFDGKGHTITFAEGSCASSFCGLFGCVDGGEDGITLKDVMVAGSVKARADGSAAFAGQAQGIVSIESVCSNAAVQAVGDVNGCAGICGAAAGGASVTISGCTNTGAIGAAEGVTLQSAAGICGNAKGTAHVRLVRCLNQAAVSAAQGAAGICGFSDDTGANTPVVEAELCANRGSISVQANYAGGIAARLCTSASKVTSCYNTGQVQGTSYVAGILGRIANSQVALSSCYNAGLVNAKTAPTVTKPSAGQITGSYYSSTKKTYYGVLSNCVYDSTVGSLKGIGVLDHPNAGTAGVLTADLKAVPAALAACGQFRVNTSPTVNNGYPLLAWEQGASASDDGADASGAGSESGAANAVNAGSVAASAAAASTASAAASSSTVKVTKNGVVYQVSKAANTAKVVGVSAKYRAKKTLTVASYVTLAGKRYAVTGIKAKAFSKAKAKVLKVATKKLSKKRVAKALAGSKITRVLVSMGTKKAGKRYAKRYKVYFAKANSGRTVKMGYVYKKKCKGWLN